MPFSKWSLLHNGSSIAIGASIGTQLITYGDGVKLECASLLVRSFFEYKYNRLKWDAILHHSCMFAPSIMYHYLQNPLIAKTIMHMQITHVPFTFRYASKITSNSIVKKICNVLYLITWIPAICYRSHVMLNSIHIFPEHYYVTIPITFIILTLDIYWTPWKQYLNFYDL